MTQKANEVFIKDILENMPLEEAIVKIAQAMTNRDAIIKMLKNNS